MTRATEETTPSSVPLAGVITKRSTRDVTDAAAEATVATVVAVTCEAAEVTLPSVSFAVAVAFAAGVASESNDGSNSADQTATSHPVITNSSPNVAQGNEGDVHQNSGSTINAPVTNNATQSNTQSNGAGQTQTVHRGDCCQPECKDECKPSARPRSASRGASRGATPATSGGWGFSFCGG